MYLGSYQVGCLFFFFFQIFFKCLIDSTGKKVTENLHLWAVCMPCFCGPIHGVHLDAFLSVGIGIKIDGKVSLWTTIMKKISPHQIILAFDLAAFNGPSTIDFIEIQPNSD